jgi:excinuclease ABC subunit A
MLQRARPRPLTGKWLVVAGAREHNLQDITIRIPLGVMTVVTGVSGSGKSTLINDILYRSLAQTLYGSREEPGAHESLLGAEQIDKVVRIDQSPIGRTPRSNPATYTQVFSPIRDLFAMLPEARERGYKAGRFSFNVTGGRCEACQGDGQRRIEMNFMPDVYVQCEVCNGRRYNQETLAVKFHGHSIADILDLTIEDALPILADVPQVRQKLQTLADVGLGYVHLGQSATTLSGGEAQRMKLARELSKRQTGRTLYLLDEPTTGLHFDDVRKLLEVLHRLVDLGNSVIIIEHNLDVIRNADWILDLGPEGGEDGGRIVGQGRPAKIAATPGSYTGQFLTRYYASANGHLALLAPDDESALTSLNDCHSEQGRRGDRVEGPEDSGAKGLRGPSFPRSSAEGVGNHDPGPSKEPGAPGSGSPRTGLRPWGESLASETWDSQSPPEIAKPKRARRATPAENDLALTRAKTKRPAIDQNIPKGAGPRKKRTGLA